MKIPATTYRLQFTPRVRLRRRRGGGSPYLHELGISDIYASPIFHARSGSMHGYDIVDPNRLNPELGSEQEFASLIDQARRHDLGWLQDIVPNHMAYDGQNRMLMDVLENGEASRFKDYFDIDWNHPYENLKAKILAPFLGEFYGDCLEKGEITLYYGQNGLSIRYYALRFPVSIESYGDVLTHNLAACAKASAPTILISSSSSACCTRLRILHQRRKARERADQIVFIKQMLWELYCQNGEIQEYIDSQRQPLQRRTG